MKKFLRQITLFLIVPIAICFCILLTPLDRKYALKSLPVDCQGRGVWIYNRLYADSTPADVIFLGTSHTINSVMDTMISNELSTPGQKVNVLNMGYCRFGSDITVTLLRDLFATRKPKIIFLEIGKKIPTTSHPVFPYYASNEDLLHPASYVQLSYPQNIYEGFLARLSQLRDHYFHVENIDSAAYVDYGYRGDPRNADPGLLIPPAPPKQLASSMWHDLELRYPEEWTQRLFALCKSNNTEIKFLYIPSYNDPSVPEEGIEFFSAYGKVLYPPANILSPKENWRDADHLNDKGAGEFSAWLVSQLKKND